MNNEIRSAIESSGKSGQAVSVDADCTVDYLWALLVCIIQCDWEMCEIEDSKVDVWGWTDNTPKNQVDFRLTVQCQPEQVEV